MEIQELKYLAALNQFSKFGPQRLLKLKTYFQKYESAFRAGLSDLGQAGLDTKTAQEFIIFRDCLSPEKIMEMLEKESIKILTPDDDIFPSALREIHCPPQILYYKGLQLKTITIT
jgi:DNA processing protein